MADSTTAAPAINRHTISNEELLRLLLDRIDALQTSEQIIELAELFLYLARADQFEAIGYDDWRMLALETPYRIFLRKVGLLVIHLPKQEAEEARRLTFDSARFFGGWLTQHNFK